MKINAFRIWALLLLGLGVAAAALPQPAWGAEARLEAVRVRSLGSGARVILRLSRATGERYFTLAHPFRAVVDLPGTEAAARLRLPRGGGLVSEVRMGRRPNGALRLVFTLRGPAAVTARWLDLGRYGHQLAILLGGQGAIGAAARPAARSPLEAIRAAHAPLDSGRDIIVAVDPGHGGVDPGTIGPHGTEEKNITLAIGRILARLIDAQRGMRAVMTRDSDVFVPLRERRIIAQRAHADLFVSIHCDDVGDRQIDGASVYILSLRGASSEAARILAQRENAADLMGGIPLAHASGTLASVLLNLSQSATISASMSAGRTVLASLERSIPVRKPAVQQAAFVVLKSPDIPSMLIETDYLSDPREELKLRTRGYQTRVAEAVFRGVEAYFRRHPPAGTLFAQERHRRLDRLLAGN
jgi:N-acetylmuramoyl-L-alanine amidase